MLESVKLSVSAPAEVGAALPSELVGQTRAAIDIFEFRGSKIATTREGDVFGLSAHDGRWRRFPRAPLHRYGRFDVVGADAKPAKLLLPVNLNLKLIYDAPGLAISRDEAGYVIDEQNKTLYYQVNGQAVRSLTQADAYSDGPPYYDCYLLADNKVMIPQPFANACSHACVMMLLAQDLPLPSLLHTLNHENKTMPDDSRRETAVYVASLRALAHREPVLLEMADQHPDEIIPCLQEHMAQYGSCILDSQEGGHVRMLDQIRQREDGVYLFKIRDPMTGSSLEVVNHQGFWSKDMTHCSSPVAASLRANCSAVFLERPKPFYQHCTIL